SDSLSNRSFPSPNSPNNIIAGFWDDLIFNYTDGSRWFYKTTGNSPNRVFTIEFNRFEPFDEPGYFFTWQIKLYETSNIIEILYGSPFDTNEDLSASAGIENENGTTGYEIPGTPNLTGRPEYNYKFIPN
ncbi:MAG: hypothetical protein K8S87_02745, partial [Planctomycetes bacterium]|nr:hypothetical protein [Planctomycetota bacterium]